MTAANASAPACVTDREDLFKVALDQMRVDAPSHDTSEADVGALVEPLVEAGAFRCILPAPHGLGLATEPDKAVVLHELLSSIGAANLAAGRLFEGHVNAVKLVFAFGSAAQRGELAAAVSEGALMGVWNAEGPPGVRLEGKAGAYRLSGSKIYASGVGLLTRPLITARNADGDILMTLPKAAARAPYDLTGWRMRGMRATATGTIRLDDVPVEEDEIVGAPGDYYRSPGFRGGAWRFAAVQLGAIEEIARLMVEGAKKRGRINDPHQKARAGRIEIAVQTARLWTLHAARTVEIGPSSPEAADACAGMARLVVERAALDVIELAERSLGLMAFAEAEPIDRVVRDLSTYLRQPFPDAVLEGIGDWAFAR